MRRPIPSFVLATLVCLPLLGCDKIKGAMGKASDEGGTAAQSGGSSTTSAALAILSGFEGEIALTAKGKGLKAKEPVNIVIDVKGDKIRADVPQGIEGADKLGKSYGIFDAPGKKLYFVMDPQKQVIVIDLNKSGEQLKGMTPSAPHHAGGGGGSAPPSNPPKITKTGKTDTVAGYSCEVWEIESQDAKDKGKAQICIAEQGVSWFHIPMTGLPAEYSFMSEMLDGKHFPLRFVAFDATGAEEGRVEITKIEKKTMDASLFVPPAGYPQMDLAQMFGGAMGGPPGMGGPGMRPGLPPGSLPHGGAPTHGR
jgi:hypothetical protein